MGESFTTLVPNDKDQDQESLGLGFACEEAAMEESFVFYC